MTDYRNGSVCVGDKVTVLPINDIKNMYPDAMEDYYGFLDSIFGKTYIVSNIYVHTMDHSNCFHVEGDIVDQYGNKSQWVLRSAFFTTAINSDDICDSKSNIVDLFS